jgi:hypothetical protein
LVGLIVLKKRWGSIFSPKFSIFNKEKKEIKHELEKGSKVEFLKNKDSII